jgi:hypothetical protein
MRQGPGRSRPPAHFLGGTNMLATQQLVTEKYLQQKLKEGLREVHRARRRKAIQNFTTFLMGLVAIPVAIWVGIQIPS